VRVGQTGVSKSLSRARTISPARLWYFLAGGTRELEPDEEATVEATAGCPLEPHGGPAFASPGEARHTAFVNTMRAGAADSP
jgi:hypothetical protein